MLRYFITRYAMTEIGAKNLKKIYFLTYHLKYNKIISAYHSFYVFISIFGKIRRNGRLLKPFINHLYCHHYRDAAAYVFCCKMGLCKAL